MIHTTQCAQRSDAYSWCYKPSVSLWNSCHDAQEWLTVTAKPLEAKCMPDSCRPCGQDLARSACLVMLLTLLVWCVSHSDLVLTTVQWLLPCVPNWQLC